MQNIYQQNGFNNRREYLECLADEYDIPLSHVLSIASVLGKEEDFDGLVAILDEAQYLEELQQF